MHATGVIMVHGQPLSMPAAADEVMTPYDKAFTALAFATTTSLPYVGVIMLLAPATALKNC